MPRKNGVPIHFMGLASAGGVHSSLGHLYALCDTAKAYGLDKVFIHAFMDGRDTDPKAVQDSFRKSRITANKAPEQSRVSVGRYYAMGKVTTAERIKTPTTCSFTVKVNTPTIWSRLLRNHTQRGVTDEFIKPIVNDRVDGRIGAGHVVIFFNYRNDRAKELTTVAHPAFRRRNESDTGSSVLLHDSL